jgi:hypothetical protein
MLLLTQSVRYMADPTLQSMICCKLPMGHAPRQPSHERVSHRCPDPHAVLQLPLLIQSVRYLAAPALQLTFCVKMAPPQVPKQPPLHVRVCSCAPVPHEVLQPPLFDHSDSVLTAPALQLVVCAKIAAPQLPLQPPLHVRVWYCKPVPHVVSQPLKLDQTESVLAGPVCLRLMRKEESLIF